ncbi:BTAD domain-containing putative transcriptional regulator [Streptomyces sp. NPDC048405]|uniref:AfsR/SARP family transcriptional regulator n=1 Tax=unclassified Streptomyces TaxID=2593676 RepID=UPI00106E6FFB|nr:BTAD domain-containing putative transcriptional regulator [Streptomyces sp. NA03103]QCE20612.1 AsmQ [Streptomyces sp.]QKW60396.1 winged helix-turn-helix domain-containing protein [Streptomyces sp. NA03103]
MICGELQVRLLGDFEVLADGVPVARWRAGKARNLLQYLITRRDTVVSRDVLSEVLWPGEDKSPGNSSLKVAAHALRKALADGPLTSGVRVEYQDFGYVLRASGIWVDCEAFRGHATRGFTLEQRGDRAAAVREYKAAAALYRGPFLPSEEARWAETERAWHQSTGLKVVQRLAALAIKGGDDFGAIEWCRRASEIDPYNERTYRLMMELHGKRGDLGMALKWYSVCESRLHDELGVPVSGETRSVLSSVMKRCDVAAP